MSLDVLTSAKPRRLFRDAAGWVLEIERLVPIHDRILRPMVQRISGDEVILFQLENSEEGRALAGVAGKLMATAAEGPRSFEVLDGHWVPSSLAESARALRQEFVQKADVASQDASRELMRAQGEILALRANFERIARRVHDLEKKVAAHEQELRRVALEGVSPALRVSTPPAAVAIPSVSAPAAGASRAAVSTPPGSPSTAAREVAAAPNAELSGAASLEAQGPRSFSMPPAALPDGIVPLAMPVLEEVVDRLKALVGDKTEAFVAAKPLDLDHGALWACVLVDDQDGVVGVMVADLHAVVSLGANLMLLPQAEIDEQMRARAPTEEVTSAMSEVFNTLSGAFNIVQDNPHVRTQPLAPFRSADHAWMASAARRLDIEDSSGGRMTFVARY